MENFVISVAGVRVPRILYGTAWKKSDTENLVRTAIRCGFRGIDTACQPKHYHEPGVGAGVAACLRGEPAWTASRARGSVPANQVHRSVRPGPGAHPLRPQGSTPGAGETVARGVAAESADGLPGWPTPAFAVSKHATDTRGWQAMESLVDVRDVRQLGISNCYRLEQLETLCDSARIQPAVLQNRFHADTGYDRELRAFCRPHRLSTRASGP